MSFSITVPADVPSLVHSSAPAPELVAEKYSRSRQNFRSAGDELPAPTLMSFTSRVPADVPSVAYSSVPVAPVAANATNPSIATNDVGDDPSVEFERLK